MKRVSKILFLLPMVVFMASCLAPTSKESYLAKFEKFVDRVEENHEKYNDKDWEWTDSQFNKFNGEWYLKYRNEFNLSDQIKIKSLIIRYHSYKSKDDVNEVLKLLFKEDVDDVRKKVEDYIDNDMDEDLEIIMEGAAAIGDSAVKVLEDIIEELEESF